MPAGVPVHLGYSEPLVCTYVRRLKEKKLKQMEFPSAELIADNLLLFDHSTAAYGCPVPRPLSLHAECNLGTSSFTAFRVRSGLQTN